MDQETQKQPDDLKNAKPTTPGAFHVIKHVTAWIMIISATLFALIGVLAIWEVFGQDAEDVIGRAFASLAIIAFASLVVNVASRVAEGKH
jgi:putative Mn2+ efflux pump MntP